MEIDKEIQLGDQQTLNLLKSVWVIWIGLSAFYALIGIFAIVMGIIAILQGLTTLQIGMGIYIDSTAILAFGIGLWVLFLGNIYIRSGLNKLDYFRWKLLVLESGLIGIMMGYTVLNELINGRLNFVSTGGLGLFLAILYLAFKVRNQFKEK